ncbi:MAG: methyltransferase family protein [bacterium]
MNSFVLKFKTGRFIWTLLVTFYFLVFFTNFFKDAMPEPAVIPFLFAYLLVFWLALEYYFGSPFFQSGVVEPNPWLRAIFAFFVYPYFAYLAADFIWWHWTQLPLPPIISGGIGLILFGLGVYLRLATLFAFLGILQTKSGGAELTILAKRFLGLRWQRFCRHPRYLATLIQLLGAALVFNSWGGLIVVLILGLPLIIAQVRYEDGVLRVQMKSDYNEYCRVVPLFLPKKGSNQGQHQKRHRGKPRAGNQRYKLD